MSVQAVVDQRRIVRGWPALNISEEQLAMLLEHRFSLTAIAHLLYVSPRTIRQRIHSVWT